MDLRGQEIKNTYGNVVTIGSSAGSPTTGELTNGQNSSFTASFVSGDFGVGITPNNYANLNTLTIGSAAASAGGIIDFTGTSGRLASIYTEASGKIVLAADPTNGEAGTALEFNVDGSNAMFIDSSRNVGIGTTSPSVALHTNGFIRSANAGNTVHTEVQNDGLYAVGTDLYLVAPATKFLSLYSGGAEAMRITSSGNVGIGTVSPTSKLTSLKTISSGFGTVGNAALSLSGAASSGDANLIQFGYDSETYQPAYIGYLSTSGSGSTNGALVFATRGVTTNTAPSERLRITSSGNVGIGTSSPLSGAKLHIASANGTTYAANAQLRISGNGVNNNVAQILFSDDALSDGKISYFPSAAASAQRFSISARSTETDFNITGEGNVGIGTSSPSQKLHIDGSVRITGAIYDSNNAAGTSGQVLSSTGTGTDWVSLSEISGVDGTGTANYVSKWSDTDTITDSQIQDDGTTVGIGQAPSTAKLTVSGDIQTAAPETSTASAWKLGNVGLGGVEVGPIDYITVSVGGFVVKLPIAIFPETQAFYDRVIADGGTFEGLLGYESAVTILKSN